MTKKLVRCPMCRGKKDEECTLAAVKEVVGNMTYIYCCETQVKKVKKE